MKRNRRNRQRGQVLVVVALMGVLLFGSAALAIDLSSDTHTKRLNQNASDAAALAGARDLNSVVDATSETLAISDALYTVGLTEGWTASPSVWWPIVAPYSAGANGGLQATETHGTCPGSGCFTVTVKTPVPLSDVVANSLCDPGGAVASNNCIEVLIASTQPNNFGGFVGIRTATIGSRSVAYHYGPGSAFPVALYAASGVLTGNSSESVVGDVYVGQYYEPQAVGGGQAGICAQTQGGNPDSGHMLFGYPQPPLSYPAPAQVPPDVTYGACTPTGLSAQANGCDIGKWQTPSSYPAGICLVGPPALQPPSQSMPDDSLAGGVLPGPLPWPSSGTLQCATITVSAPPVPGVYEVKPKAGGCGGNTPDLTIDFGNATSTLKCYSFILDRGASVLLSTHKDGGTIDAYNDPTDGCTAAPLPSGAADNGSAHDVFWSAPNSVVTITDKGNGCCPNFVINGSIYIPNIGSTVNTVTNTAISVNGQAIVGLWNDQSGNHPGPIVTYVQNQAAPVPEVLRLVQ